MQQRRQCAADSVRAVATGMHADVTVLDLNIARSRPTTPAVPTYRVNESVLYCVANRMGRLAGG